MKSFYKIKNIITLRMIKLLISNDLLLSIMFAKYRYDNAKETYLFDYLSDAGSDTSTLLNKIQLNAFLFKIGRLRSMVWHSSQFEIDYNKEVLSKVSIDYMAKKSIINNNVILMIHPCDTAISIGGIISVIDDNTNIVFPIYGDTSEWELVTKKTYPNKKIHFINTQDSNSITKINKCVRNGAKLLIFADLPSRKNNMIFGRAKEIKLFNKKAFIQYGTFLLCTRHSNKTTFIRTSPNGINKVNIESYDVTFVDINDLMSKFIRYFEETILEFPESIAYLPRLPTYHYQPLSPYDTWS